MTPVLHAHHARELIRAAGGLEAAASICRLKRSRLAECQDPVAGAFLPIDVVAALELATGNPAYTRALTEEVERQRTGHTVHRLVEDACAATETCAEVQAELRGREGGRLTRAEREQLLREADRLDDLSARLREQAQAHEPAGGRS